MPRTFRVRGIVEGFYGRPWSHAARCSVLSFVGERGMNAYVYAPKDDPKHRAQWRTPYEPEELTRLRDLAAYASRCGIEMGFAISPGLDIDYEATHERSALLDKLRPLVGAGVPWVVLALDDIAPAPGLADQQADLVAWLLAALRGLRPDVRLTLVPTEYVGTVSSPYLADLARGVPAEVDVMWTGPTVCSPVLRATDARAFAAAVAPHGVLVWDNYPVNDATMEDRLHLGPYRGRDPGLADVVEGVLLNPMTQPHASRVALATACDHLGAPDDYDEGSAWERAIADVGGDDAAPLAVLARACADGPLAAPGTLDLARAVAALRADPVSPVLDRVVAELRAARALPDAFPRDAPPDSLAGDVAPWADAARAEADAGLAATRLLHALRGTGDGVPTTETAERLLRLAFVFVTTWANARRNRRVVYGPRFAVYPAVLRLAGGEPVLDVDPAVVADANPVDALCRLALEGYRGLTARWTASPRRVPQPDASDGG